MPDVYCMNPISLTHFLFDHEKGWDRNNWAVEEKGRRRFGRLSGVAVGGPRGSWAGVGGTRGKRVCEHKDLPAPPPAQLINFLGTQS